jgi:hypothetical protein
VTTPPRALISSTANCTPRKNPSSWLSQTAARSIGPVLSREWLVRAALVWM